MRALFVVGALLLLTATSFVFELSKTAFSAGLSGTLLVEQTRLEADVAGDLDPSFDVDGIVTTHLTDFNEVANSVEIQPDGKILVSGFVSYNGPAGADLVVARYNLSGTLDTTFDGDGIAILDTLGGRGILALQPDGKLIILGGYNGPSPPSTAVVELARLNSDGSLDTTFDGDGKVATPTGGFLSTTSVAVQSDGKILAAGGISDGIDQNTFVYRYNIDGSLDTTFDGDGKVLIEVSPSDDEASKVLVQDDSKIIVGGFELVERMPNVFDDDFALVRLNSNGSLDTTFDSDGIVTTPIGPNLDRAFGMALQSDQKIVLTGFTQDSSFNWDFAAVRYNANGSLDTTFDGDGKAITKVGDANDIGMSVRIQPNGKIVVAGNASNGSNNDFAVVRYHPEGSLDTTFSGDGRVMTPIGSGEDQARELAIQSDGKIVLAGSSRIGTNDDFSLVRYFGEDEIPMPTPTATPTLTPSPTPTPATVSVSGRVTTPGGLGLRNAVVLLTNSHGVAQMATTSSFGIYAFSNIVPGQQYVIGVSSKRYRFAPRSMTINGNLTDVDFVGLE